MSSIQFSHRSLEKKEQVFVFDENIDIHQHDKDLELYHDIQSFEVFEREAMHAENQIEEFISDFDGVRTTEMFLSGNWYEDVSHIHSQQYQAYIKENVLDIPYTLFSPFDEERLLDESLKLFSLFPFCTPESQYRLLKISTYFPQNHDKLMRRYSKVFKLYIIHNMLSVSYKTIQDAHKYAIDFADRLQDKVKKEQSLLRYLQNMFFTFFTQPLNILITVVFSITTVTTIAGSLLFLLNQDEFYKQALFGWVGVFVVGLVLWRRYEFLHLMIAKHSEMLRKRKKYLKILQKFETDYIMPMELIKLKMFDDVEKTLKDIQKLSGTGKKKFQSDVLHYFDLPHVSPKTFS